MAVLLSRLRQIIGFNPPGWIRAQAAMKRRVREFLPLVGSEATGPGVLVVISPWQGTSIPWFTLAVGLMMARDGARIRFALDDVLNDDKPFRHRFVLGALRGVLRIVAARFTVLILSDFPRAPLDADDRAEIERLAALNATWALRGEMPQRGRAALVARSVRQTTVAQGHIAGLFAAIELPDVLFVPGGVFADSGLWFREARKRGLRVASFDTGGYQTTMVAADGMACQLQDVPRAFRLLEEHWRVSSFDRAAALARADSEIERRRQGTDTFESQIAGAGDGGSAIDGGILVALNSSWDAAALGPHRAFETNTEWILGTVRYLLSHTDRPIVVRQHPAERLAIAATSEDYGQLLREAFGTHERLHFIAATDPVNSYALLERVSAVVVHTSTIGMEAVAFGRPVVTGSASYYSDLGFVSRADTRKGYEALLAAAARGELTVTDAMRDSAKLCFYITQCCNWVFSVFNPADFARWIDRPLAEWQAEPAVARMVESLITGVPVAALNHQSGFSEAR